MSSFSGNRKQLFSAERLHEAVWDEPYYYGANNTVTVHIRNLRRKAELDPIIQLSSKRSGAIDVIKKFSKNCKIRTQFGNFVILLAGHSAISFFRSYGENAMILFGHLNDNSAFTQLNDDSFWGTLYEEALKCIRIRR